MESINAPTMVGSNLKKMDKEEITDAVPLREHIVNTQLAHDLVVDVISDKNCDVVITPIIDIDDDTSSGGVSETGTVTADESARFVYSGIGAAKAKVSITKTGSGDTSGFCCVIRGQV
jgi:hypothetical protein